MYIVTFVAKVPGYFVFEKEPQLPFKQTVKSIEYEEYEEILDLDRMEYTITGTGKIER